MSRTYVVVAIPNAVAAFTGHVAYRIGARYVWRLDATYNVVARVPRSHLPADFGPDMKAGAFGMADAFNAAQGRAS